MPESTFNAATEHENYVSNADLSPIEDKAYIEEEIRRYPIKAKFYERFCDKKPWVRGAKRFTFRKLVKPEVTSNDITPLKEGVAANPDTMQYEEYEVSVNNYASYIPYTKEAVQFNKDNVVNDAAHQIKFKSVKVPEELIGRELAKSRIQLTYAGSVTSTFDNSLVVMSQNEIEPTEGGLYAAIVTPAVIKALKGELRVAGQSDLLTPDMKSDLSVKGQVYDYNGHKLFVKTDAFLYDSEGNSKIIILGRNEQGEMATVMTGNSAIDVDIRPLGYGVIKDENGSIVPDTNKRVGAIAWNLDAFGVATQADLAKLVCVTTIKKVVGVTTDSSVTTADSSKTSSHVVPKALAA